MEDVIGPLFVVIACGTIFFGMAFFVIIVVVMKRKLLSTVLAIFILIGITACGGGYYMVKDPATDKTYYTDKIKEEKGGAIKLKDANTGSEVTLQTSEVTKINKEEFKANTKKD